MCGITGFFDLTPTQRREDLRAACQAMQKAIAHRGPDDFGIWDDENTPLFLAHRRLAIIDLSPEGRQPMISASGRYVISFNGEIYNFPQLREELTKAGARFRGHSDTEVMLAAFDAWGIEQALQKFNGMFAFALWDREMRELHLVRDRLGKKPLYIGWAGGALLFASELKSFHVTPMCPRPSRFSGMCGSCRRATVLRLAARRSRARISRRSSRLTGTSRISLKMRARMATSRIAAARRRSLKRC
jgi:asparagine synthase (glutamine-hydrolysing)